MAAMIEVDGVHVRNGDLVALRGVSLTVAEGEVVCVIGPNGAGKSSTLAAIAGGVTPYQGSISFEGRNIVGMRPEHIARLGLSLVPEGRHIFGTLTVEANLQIGGYVRSHRAAANDASGNKRSDPTSERVGSTRHDRGAGFDALPTGRKADERRLLELFPRLAERLRAPAGRLSGGEQQKLALAGAVMTKPRVLLVDEPSLGLAPRIVDQKFT